MRLNTAATLLPPTGTVCSPDASTASGNGAGRPHCTFLRPPDLCLSVYSTRPCAELQSHRSQGTPSIYWLSMKGIWQICKLCEFEVSIDDCSIFLLISLGIDQCKAPHGILILYHKKLSILPSSRGATEDKVLRRSAWTPGAWRRRGSAGRSARPRPGTPRLCAGAPRRSCASMSPMALFSTGLL